MLITALNSRKRSQATSFFPLILNLLQERDKRATHVRYNVNKF